MDLGFTGRVALVCGSTGGIGLAAAQELSREGAKVVVSGRRGDLAREIAASMEDAVGVESDFTQPNAAEKLYNSAVEAFGRVDIVILNGPGPAPGAARDIGRDEFGAAIQALARFPIELANIASAPMVEEQWGRLVLVGSSGVVSPIPGLAASNIGRAAATAYMKTLSAELATHGVTANVVVPGRIATSRVAELDLAQAGRTGTDVESVAAASQARIPMGRYGRPDEMAGLIAFLCSERASYITGSIVRCDGGLISSY